MAVLKVRQSDGTYKSIKTIKGKSAYELAVANGYNGTEKEWLASLVGGFEDLTQNNHNELNTDNKTIIGSINELKSDIDNIDVKDVSMKVTDANSHFTADEDGNKYLSSVLDQLFQFADNGKKSIASTIGSPLSADDSFSDMNAKIQKLLDSIKETLESKGITLDGDGKLESLIDKIYSDMDANIDIKYNDVKTTLVNAMKSKGAKITGEESLKELIDLAITKLEYFSNIYPGWYTGDASNQDGNLWITAKSMTVARYGLTSSVVNKNIYCIGGWDGSNVFNKNECYNPSTNTWTTKAAMKTPRYGLTSSAAGNKIYCIGGTASTANECYDPSSNTWTSKTDMITARYDLVSSVVDNKIYCIGGTGGTTANECYDPSTNTWSTKTDMITARYGLTSSVVDNKIYCIGGSASIANECYDPSTNTWSTKANMTTLRSGLTSSVIDNKIYVIGFNNNTSINRCYDPSTNTWTTKAAMKTPRYGLTSSVVNKNIYCIGGWDGSNVFNKNECYIPSQN